MKMGVVELVRRQDEDARTETGLDLAQLVTLFVEQKGRGLDRQVRVYRLRVLLECLLLEDPQETQGRGGNAPDTAGAFATRAGNIVGITDGRTQTLSGHLEQPETGDAPDLHAGAVGLQRVVQPVLDEPLVLRRGHVDQIDDDQAAEVADAQLAGHLVHGLEIGLQRRLLDIGALGRPRGVHVDGDNRLGVVDHEGSTRGQPDLASVRGLDLVLDLEAREQRNVVFVQLEPDVRVRHDLVHETRGAFVDRGLVDENL